jgi:hypothetical protein
VRGHVVGPSCRWSRARQPWQGVLACELARGHCAVVAALLLCVRCCKPVSMPEVTRWGGVHGKMLASVRVHA